MEFGMNVIRQMQFIEVVMQWEGQLTNRRLQEYFDLSRPTARDRIRQYQEKHPDNRFEYDASIKRFLPGKHFQPQLTQGSLSEYLIFFGESLTGPFADQANILPYIETLQPPVRNIDPHLVRKIIEACKKQWRLDCDYFSVTSGKVEGRIISPHTLINDGLRWHVRAYCEKSRGYRDLVLSRFQGEPSLESPAEYTRAQDDDWNAMVNIVLTPDSRLSAARQHCIELDYCMTDGQLQIPCRGAMVKYLLQRLRVDNYHHKPEGQQIVVDSECWEALAPYRMD